MAQGLTYAQFRFRLMFEVLTGTLTPEQVAGVLQAKQAEYPQIDAVEIARLRRMGRTWVGNSLEEIQKHARTAFWS